MGSVSSVPNPDFATYYCYIVVFNKIYVRLFVKNEPIIYTFKLLKVTKKIQDFNMYNFLFIVLFCHR